MYHPVKLDIGQSVAEKYLLKESVRQAHWFEIDESEWMDRWVRYHNTASERCSWW